MRKIKNRITPLTLSMGLICSTFAPISAVSNVHAQTTSSVEQVLSKLTPAQRQALKQLQTSDQTGLQISSDVNLETDKPISVIVEFETKPSKIAMLESQLQGESLTSSSANQLVEESHENFKNDASKILKQKQYKIKRTYKTSFNGVSMTLPANQVKSLLKSTTVKAVWSDSEVHIDPPVDMKDNATNVSNDSSNMPSSMPFLGIDKLHEEGYTGKGVKVGIIDTGIDYNHPDLKDAYKGGYDFVDNDSDPMETTYDDWVKAGKPFGGSGTYYTEHGTHVSGTIAARGKNNSPNALVGVAPDADLYMYRALGPYGSGTLDAIMAGIDKAVQDGMDVINLSLGTNYNDPLFVTSVAINNAVLQGVTAVVAAGNAGPNSYTVGSPGAAALALTVGASDVRTTVLQPKGTLHTSIGDLPASQMEINAENFDNPISGFKGQSLPIVDVGKGLETDFANKNVAGKIVLTNIYYANVSTKIATAKKYGAKAVILYDPDQTYTSLGSLGKSPNYLPTFFIPKQEGNAIYNQLKQSGEASFTFDDVKEVVSSEGDHLASFSSKGPTKVTYDIKPEITAPGVQILSTVPSYINGPNYIGNYNYAYQQLSGTSMATPHVSGIAALLLQKNPDYTPADIKTILMNTADPLKDSYSVYEVGAGRVDPYEAIHSDAEVQVSDETPMIRNGKEKQIKEKTGAISFGTVAPSGQNVGDKRTLTIYNNSKQAKTFDVKVAFQKDRLGSKDADANGVGIVTDKTIKVNAASKKQSVVSIFIPKTAALGTYEGYITYTNQSNPDEVYQVPFAVRLVEKGVYGMIVSPNVFTTETDSFHLAQINNASVMFEFKSHMRYVDLVLEDSKTNKEIGYIGQIDGIPLMDNVTYYLQKAFDGSYYPLTSDEKNPIADEKVMAPQGAYKIKLIATEDDGTTYETESPVYIDNEKPTLKLDKTDGVYEYESGQQTVQLKGSIIDGEYADMNANGINLTQSSNKLMYSYNGGTNQSKPVAEDGTFSVDVPMIESNPLLAVQLYGLDAATNKDFRSAKQFFFAKKGTSYAISKPDKQDVKMGETFKYTLSLNNVKDLRKADFAFKYLKTYFDLIDVKPNPEASKYGEVNINQEIADSGTLRNMKITATIPEQANVSGNIPLVDITLKVRDDKFMKEPTALVSTSTSYTNTANNVVQVKSADFYVSMIPTYSETFGDVKAEGLMKNGAVNFGVDHTTVGGTIKAVDVNGIAYNGVILKTPSFTLSKLPITNKPLTFVMDIPGHFTVRKPFLISDNDNGSLIGQRMLLNYNPAIAGDVNKDDVIDVLDALYIQTYWGTSKREADINFDGKVDAADMGFVKKNYLMQNPTATNAPKPKKTYKGQTLESVLESLNIQ
ncbi:S8 family serine peptidase [Gottfriedia acidiceleris]|uniref:S8 family serine peptidase n=1 Tax=Gottfriedia acidiceleris TaxID=371036 RepID=A0ABY4JNL0_9BACI|nr:S8 family serine peptidase [Gottfriedia acidiceleris]UPM55429.1 S8 family serine peptidase [Gottfriedia acidiceleris]